THIDLSLAFFFSSRRRHTRSKRDWSSDVCTSALPISRGAGRRVRGEVGGAQRPGGVLGELSGAFLGRRAGPQRLPQLGRGAGAGAVGPAARGDGLVLPAGLGDPGAVGLERRRRGGELGALALGGEGGGLLGAAQAGGLLVEGGQGRLELGGRRLRAARPLDLGGRLVDGGPRGLGGEVPGGLAEPGELLA